MKHVVEVDEDIRIRARRAIEAMLALPRPTRPATFLRGRPRVPVELI
jgi:quinolinate synthase